MFNFENLHRNHKFAFADGLLCGLLVAGYAWYYAKEKSDTLANERVRITNAQSYIDGHQHGAQYAFRETKRFVDLERFEKINGPYPV